MSKEEVPCKRGGGIAGGLEHEMATMMDMMSKMAGRMDRIEAGQAQHDPNSAKDGEGRQPPKKSKKKGKMMQVMEERAGLTEGGTEEEGSGPEKSEEDDDALVAWVRQQKSKKVRKESRMERLRQKAKSANLQVTVAGGSLDLNVDEEEKIGTITAHR